MADRHLWEEETSAMGVLNVLLMDADSDPAPYLMSEEPSLDSEKKDPSKKKESKKASKAKPATSASTDETEASSCSSSDSEACIWHHNHAFRNAPTNTHVDAPVSGITWTLEDLGPLDPETQSLCAPLRLPKTGSSAISTMDTSESIAPPSIPPERLAKLRQAAVDKSKEVRSLVRGMVNAQRLSLCFLVDCTGSMGPYIRAVQNHVVSMASTLAKSHSKLDLRLAFVRYTDFDEGENRHSWIDFTNSLGNFTNFVEKLAATGGGDAPEDVFGGLQVALTKLSWGTEGTTNVLVHIGDSPQHGKQYFTGEDSFPGGDPNGLTPAFLMQLAFKQNIQYWFGNICPNLTDLMVKALSEALVGAGGARIQTFNALADPTELSRSISSLSSVSIMTTITTMTATRTRTDSKSTTKKSDDKKDKTGDDKGDVKNGIPPTDDHRVLREYQIDPTVPKWKKLPICEAFEIRFKMPSFERVVRDDCNFQTSSQKLFLKIAPEPFAEGALRLAYRARLYTSAKADESTAVDMVLKRSKYVSALEDSAKRAFVDLETSATAASLVAHYKTQVPASRIVLASASVVKFFNDPHATKKKDKYTIKVSYFSLEKYFPGEYEKWSSNNGWTSAAPLANELSAFSHWTWQVTGGKLMVTDLQGVHANNQITLTDPTIHSQSLRFGKTNLGNLGLRQFFASHMCFDQCRALNLEHPLVDEK